MLLKILHFIGLTNLSDEQVYQYYDHLPNRRKGPALSEQGVAFMRLLKRYSPTANQLKDIEIFLCDKRNLMDPAQLAKEQLEAQQIYVIAPKPLEVQNKEVFESTVEWLQHHLADDKARMVFWTAASDEDKPPLVSIIKRLLARFKNDERVLQRLECVQAPDELFLVDYTIWQYPEGRLRAFVNERRKGVTFRLFELNEQAAYDLVDKLYKWLERCRDDRLLVVDPGPRLANLQEKIISNSIQRRIITRYRETKIETKQHHIKDSTKLNKEG